MHDVFISYSHKDKAAADTICARLEKDGMRCWYAPRDIVPGMEWASSIIEAIESARVMVLVFSDSSNSSVQVIREVSCAVNAGIPVIPFRLTDMEPNGSMQYYLSTVHWLDAVDDSLERKTVELSEMIRRILGTEKSKPATAETGMQKRTFGGKRRAVFIATAAVAILVLAGILWTSGVFNPRETKMTLPVSMEAPDKTATKREFTIMRTDELETMTAEEKGSIRHLLIAGEYACNGELYGAVSDPIVDGEQGYLVSLETGEKIPFSAGKMKDLHSLEEMNNLTNLEIIQQPLISVNGIENFSKLIDFSVGYCSALMDVSEVFGMEKVKTLAIIACPNIMSIHGISRMKSLLHLTFGLQSVTDYSELSAFEHLSALDMLNIDIGQWDESVRNTRIDRLSVGGPELQQDELTTVIEAHPEIVELHIYHGVNLTDLGFLTRMPNLKTVVITRNIEALTDTIDGSQARFRLYYLD